MPTSLPTDTDTDTDAGPAHRFAVWFAHAGITTGQSVVTDRVQHLLAAGTARTCRLMPGAGPGAILAWLRCIAGLWLDVAAGRIGALYLVCSRSSFGFWRDVPAYLVQLAGVRVVVHAHGSDIVLLARRRLARRLLARCELIVPSGHLPGPLKALGLQRCEVCENFAEWAPARDERRAATATPFSVLWNSNILASKGFFEVAEAVASLHSAGHAVRLVALGAPLGDERMARAECGERLARLVGSAWLDWRGPVGREDARQALACADLVCLPSRYASECQPLALVEAMCAGKAVLIADTPPLRATVGDYPCRIASPPDAPSIAEALRAELAARGLGLAAQHEAAARARDRFSARRFDQAMSRLLDIGPSRTPSTEAAVS